jgi:hypothetical protein
MYRIRVHDWWAKYYPSDNMQRPTGPTCDGCHSAKPLTTDASSFRNFSLIKQNFIAPPAFCN